MGVLDLPEIGPARVPQAPLDVGAIYGERLLSAAIDDAAGAQPLLSLLEVKIEN